MTAAEAKALTNQVKISAASPSRQIVMQKIADAAALGLSSIPLSGLNLVDADYTYFASLGYTIVRIGVGVEGNISWP